MRLLKKTNNTPSLNTDNSILKAAESNDAGLITDKSSTPLNGKALVIRILVIIAMVILGANFGFSAMYTGLIYLPLKLLKLSSETAGIITFCVMTAAVTAGYIAIRRLKQYKAYASAFYIPFMLFNILTFVVKIL